MPAFSLSRRTGQVTVHSRVNDWMTLGEFLATGMFFSGIVSNLYIPSVVISQATPVNNLTTEQKPLRGRRNKSSRVSPQNIYEGPPSPPRLNLFFFFLFQCPFSHVVLYFLDQKIFPSPKAVSAQHHSPSHVCRTRSQNVCP